MQRFLPYLLTTVGLLILQAAVPTLAQSVLYDKSTITCIVKQENVPVEAAFKRFTGQISFDPDKPEASKARIEIDINSFDFGNADVNGMAKAKDWFNARDFPNAIFVASAVRSLGAGRFEVRGSLTLKGKSAEVAAPFTYKKDGANGTLDGTFTIKRLQYNVGEGMWKDTDTVADDVQIKFHIVAGVPNSAKK